MSDFAVAGALLAVAAFLISFGVGWSCPWNLGGGHNYARMWQGYNKHWHECRECHHRKDCDAKYPC